MLASVLVGGILALALALALAWKWDLGVGRVALAVAGLGALAAFFVFLVDALTPLRAVVAGGLTWLLTLTVATVLLGWRFYRDPERTPPDRDDVVLSPADGEVIYVQRARDGVLPASSKHGRTYQLEELTKTALRSGDAMVVGISLSFLDVHVNRAPIAGEVTLLRHHVGRFGSLRRPESVFENERATIVIEREELQLAVVLIASRLVRRIVSYVSTGDRLVPAQRLGVIRFGSQVDLVIPAHPGMEIAVAPGARLTAGETVVALLGASRDAAGSELGATEA